MEKREGPPKVEPWGIPAVGRHVLEEDPVQETEREVESLLAVLGLLH